ncbi:Nuclease associated modular domain 3 [uncultured Caudovirales phage]|uniref:Nuclease associated modular domain 3 n=1 Tax=uncultured Caudovirales phage TaxID=2100421 RepID=A0A6J5KKS6_9CAUD|nr:Nuclease associated modular domain 3 [uncultured Caudovirales phage]
MKYMIYCHLRNDTNEIFYIGKGQKNRPYDSNGRNKHWKNIASKHGFTVQILSYFESEIDAYNEEKKLIAKYKSLGFALANLTDGGEGALGMPKSDETKRKISESKIGVKNPLIVGELNPAFKKEVRLKKSISMKNFYSNGGINPMTGKKRNDLSDYNKSHPKIGLNNHKSKSIIVNNVKYESILLASKATGIGNATLRWRAINASDKFNTYFDSAVS